MRVTSYQMREQRTLEVLAGEERLARAQNQVTTGKKLQRPSDAPDQIAELLQVRSNITDLTRQRDSADAVLPDMQAREAALSDISDALRQVRTLALQANDATLTADDRAA